MIRAYTLQRKIVREPKKSGNDGTNLEGTADGTTSDAATAPDSATTVVETGDVVLNDGEPMLAEDSEKPPIPITTNDEDDSDTKHEFEYQQDHHTISEDIQRTSISKD